MYLWRECTPCHDTDQRTRSFSKRTSPNNGDDTQMTCDTADGEEKHRPPVPRGGGGQIPLPPEAVSNPNKTRGLWPQSNSLPPSISGGTPKGIPAVPPELQPPPVDLKSGYSPSLRHGRAIPRFDLESSLRGRPCSGEQHRKRRSCGES